MNAADIMTLGAVTIRSNASVEEAARLMLEFRISGLPVLDAGGAIIGIVTEGDFLRRPETGTERRRTWWLEFFVGSERLAAEYVQSRSRKVEDVMTRTVVTVTEDMPVGKIVELMERHRIKRVPVVRDGKVVGVVSRANFLRAVANLASEAPVALASDEEVQKQIMAELNGLAWAKSSGISVLVRNGIAYLSGFVFEESKRDAMRVAVENVPGVRAVKNSVSCINPATVYATD